MNIFLCSMIASCATSAKVTTKFGDVIGSTREFNGKVVRKFTGIPYAEPPVGNLRFKRAVAFEGKFESPLDATRLPKSCLQPPFLKEVTAIGFDEDCLYLNVWSPEKAKKLPVMVWIHGGGFHIGSSVQNAYEGTVLAAEGEVVVVSVNYRLGIFGFLSTDETGGNMAFSDMIEALRWVKANIESFGGDPGKVTIFGQSAGAVAVSALLHHEESGDLFRNAIIESGTYLMGGIVWDEATARKVYAKFRESIECPEGHDLRSCLVDMPGEKVLGFTQNQTLYSGAVKWPGKMFGFCPVYPSKEFPADPIQTLIAKTKESSDKNVMIGFNQDEGAMFILMDKSIYNFTGDQIDEKSALGIVKSYLSRLPIPASEYNSDDFAEYYINRLSLEKRRDSNELIKALARVMADLAFNCPSVYFTEKLAQNNPNVYGYKNKFITSAPKFFPTFPDTVDHFQEVPYIFGLPLADVSGPVWSETDKKMSRYLINAWTHFAKHGKPPGHWPSYRQLHNGKVMPFNKCIDSAIAESGSDSECQLGCSSDIISCEALWYDLIEKTIMGSNMTPMMLRNISPFLSPHIILEIIILLFNIYNGIIMIGIKMIPL